MGNVVNGVDEFLNIEMLRFGAEDVARDNMDVSVSALRADENFPVELAEITGSDGYDNMEGNEDGRTISGNTGGDIIDARAGDGMIHGNEDNDIIDGGFGDDIIDGGSGNDMAAYDGTVDGYAIWRTGTDDASRAFVPEKYDGASTLGRGTLTNVETLGFVSRDGMNTDVTLANAIDHDDADMGTMTTDMAPMDVLNATVDAAIFDRDVADWFIGCGTLTCSATGAMNGALFADGMITGAPPARTDHDHDHRFQCG